MSYFDRHQNMKRVAKAWDESKHPRVPAGSGDPSGEFTNSTNGAGNGTLPVEDQGGTAMHEIPLRLPRGFPKDHSIHVQRDTEMAGYVALISVFKRGMRHSVQVGRAYGSTEAEAWGNAVKQGLSGTFNVL